MAIKTVDVNKRIKFVSALDTSIVHDKSNVSKYKEHYSEDAANEHLVFDSTPTWFTRRPLTAGQRAALEDMCKGGVVDGEEREFRFNTARLAVLAFRVGVTGIDDPSIKFNVVNEKGMKMVSNDVVDILPPIIVQEIGTLIWVKDSTLTDDEKKG